MDGGTLYETRQENANDNRSLFVDVCASLCHTNNTENFVLDREANRLSLVNGLSRRKMKSSRKSSKFGSKRNAEPKAIYKNRRQSARSR